MVLYVDDRHIVILYSVQYTGLYACMMQISILKNCFHIIITGIVFLIRNTRIVMGTVYCAQSAYLLYTVQPTIQYGVT